VDVKDSDPACPIKGLPSVNFDFSLARESEEDKKAGRVGGDPSQFTKAAPGQATGPYGAPPPEMLAAEDKKKSGFLGGLFRK
jgi:catechol 1,2-dioxygenase/hydroxyquinol 1,2-dioxygenase